MSNKQLAVIGGAKDGGGASAPVTAPDTLRSLSILEFIDAISEGELEGFATADPLESVFLGETAVKSNGELNFEGVNFDYRLGTQGQTHIAAGEMSLEENPSAAIEYLVNAKIENVLPVVRTITSILADRVRIRLRIDALWKRDIETGNVNGTEVEVQIAIRASGGAYVDALPVTEYHYEIVDSVFVKDLRVGPGIIRGKASSAYERSYSINLQDYGSPPYDIKVTRVTPDSPQDGLIADIVNFAAYTELITAKLRYPNTAHARLSFDSRHFSNIPSRGYLLKGIKVRVPGPAFYDPVARTYTGTDWDGTFVTAWTRCPAWIHYDLVTDPRYGLGKEVAEEYVDKWNLWTHAKRCDALVSDGFGGQEPRYSLDLYLQADGEAKNVIQDIVSNFDAMAFWHSGGIHLTQDAPKTVSALYTPANVVNGQFNYAGSSRQARITVVLVEWNDPDDFYKTAVEYIEDSSGIERYGYRETNLVAIGCTSRAQAHRRGKHLLLTSRLETDVVTFSVGLSGLVNKPGDIIRVADPLKSEDERLGGRVAQGATTTEIPLDAEVTLAGGESYTLCITFPDGSVSTAPVSSVAGAHQTLTLSPALASAPEHNAVWSLYSGAIPSREYRVLWTTENNEPDGGFYDISAVTYDADKYAQIEDGLQLQPIFKDPYRIDTIEPPTNMAAVAVHVADELSITTHIDISWTPSVNRFVNEHEFYWILDDGQINYVPNIIGSTYRIENAVPGEYSFRLRAKTIAGSVSNELNNYFILFPFYIIGDISIINIGVRGLGNEFFGRNAEFSWESDADVVLDIPAKYSSGSGGSSKWFRDFEVNIFDADGTTLRRTESVTEFYYNYTYEKNVEDGGGVPVRSVVVSIRARSELDNYSPEASFAATNNPPNLFPTISFLPSEGSLAISFTDPVDYDYSYTRFFASQTSGFTPGPASLIWEGSDNFINIPIKSEFAGTWYVRAQIVDEFGVSGTSYTPEVSQQVFAPPGLIDPVTADNIIASIEDFNASNNRNPDPIVNPTIATDGTAIDHTVNSDGSIDVSVEWSWSGQEGDIDGFAIFVHADDNIAPHIFAIDETEKVWQVPAYSRTFIWRGVSADPYYTVGVVAYRKVDPDIVSSGLINSSLITANGADENPYHAPNINPASGDITTTINGILAAHVNDWEFIGGAGRPFDNADVTLDQISGSGVNVINGEYSIVNSSKLPPYTDRNGIATLDVSVQYFGQPMIKLSATASNARIIFGINGTDYNTIITPHKKWVVSCYVKSGIANAAGQIRIRANVSGLFYTLNFLTSPTPDTITRVSGEIDLSADSSFLIILRAENDAGAGVDMWFQGFMMEQLIGSIVAPSAYSRPVAHTAGGVYIADAVDSAINYNQSNDNNSDPISAPALVTNGLAIEHVINTDGSADVAVNWSWSDDEGDIDGFSVLVFATLSDHGGSHTFGTDPEKEISFIFPAHKRSNTFLGVSADSYYTIGVIAYRKVNKNINPLGIIVSEITYASGTGERPYRPSLIVSFLGDVLGEIDGVPASEVAVKSVGAFDGTINYRTPGSPSNSVTALTRTIVSNSIGGRDITLHWGAYTQGVRLADFLILFIKEGVGTPTVNDSSIQFNVNTGSPSYFTFENVDASKEYTAGIATARRTENGIEIGVIVSHVNWHVASGNIDNVATDAPWGAVSGTGKPEDNADVTFDNLSGSGINIINSEYSLVTSNEYPPHSIFSGSLGFDPAYQLFGHPMVYLDSTAANCRVNATKNASAYNFILAPNKKWIISLYVASPTPNLAGRIRVRTSDLGAFKTFNFVTSATPTEITRVSGVLDLTLDSSTTALIRVHNPTSGTRLLFTGIMLEEQVGGLDSPSAYVIPSVTTVNGVTLSEIGVSIENFDTSNDQNGGTIVAPIFLTGGNAINHTINEDSSVDASVSWSWSGDEGDIDGFAITTYVSSSNPGGSYVIGTNPEKEMVFQLPAHRRSIVFAGIPAISYYSIGLVAYRAVDKNISANGLILSSIAYPTFAGERPYRPSSNTIFNGDVQGSIDGTPANTVAISLAEGATAFNETVQYRSVGAPSTIVFGHASTIVSNSVGGRDITLLWSQYSQGVRKADFLILFIREGSGTPTVLDSAIQFNVNTTATSYYTFKNVDITKQYTAGIAAARKTENGVEVGLIVSHGSWSISAGTPNNTATNAPWSVVSGAGKPQDNADATNYASSLISNNVLQNNLLRIARPVGGEFSHDSGNITGVIRIRLPQSWTRTMMKFTVDVFLWGTDRSFSLEVSGYNNSTGSHWQNTTAKLTGSAASDNRVRFGHDGSRCCIYIGETFSSWPWPKIAVRDFQGGFQNFSQNQWDDGWSVTVTTSVGAITSTISDALIDANSIKNQGALATANSVTANQVNTSSLSAITANLGTITAGSISVSTNIDTGGTGNFHGITSSQSGSASIVANDSKVTTTGIIAFSPNTGGIGVYGVGGSGSVGIRGQSLGSGKGMLGINSGTGTAVEGLHTGTTGNAVKGVSTHVSGYAGYFSNTSGGTGVRSYATGGGAVRGEATTSGTGVRGISNSGFAMRATATSSSQALRVDGNLHVTGNITYVGTATDVSDIRLKSEVETLTDSSQNLKKLRGVSYERGGIKRIGVIAQEVERVYPELVNHDTAGHLTVRTPELIGVLIEAQKESLKRIETLEAQLINITNRLETLENV